MATQAYRHLLRSANLAFKGDNHLLKAARIEITQKFRENSSLDVGHPQVRAAIQHANEVAQILRQNIVQGERIKEGEDRFRLKIHDETERGDNDTIKMPNGQKVVIDGKKCSDL